VEPELEFQALSIYTFGTSMIWPINSKLLHCTSRLSHQLGLWNWNPNFRLQHIKVLTLAPAFQNWLGSDSIALFSTNVYIKIHFQFCGIVSGAQNLQSVLRSNSKRRQVISFDLNDTRRRYLPTSGGFKVGGPEARLKRGAPLMTSSFSANRDKHFDQT